MTRSLAVLVLAAATLSLPANAAQQPTFDWTKPTVKGDVLEALGSTIRNDTLDLGVGKIALSDDSALFEAKVDPAGLHLKIQLYKPGQRLRFDDLEGATGSYKPFKWRARRIRITKSPHDERFVRKGVLTLTVPNPNPKEAIAGKPPGVPKETSPLLPPGYEPRDETFARLAAAVSQQYEMPGRNTLREYRVQWREAADAGANYPAPEVRKYAQAMLEGAKRVREINVVAVRSGLLREAQDLERRIANGDFTSSRREGYRENGIVAFRTVTEDSSGSAASRARYLRDVAAKNDVDLKKWQATQLQTNGWADLFLGDGISKNPDHQFQSLVIEARKALLEEAAKHAGPKSKTSLVELSRPDTSTLGVRNTSGKQLTDVVLDLTCGISRSDKVKRYGAPSLVFVPVWSPNERLDVQLAVKEPRVLHASVYVYAKEALNEDVRFSVNDPQTAPDNTPGTIVLQSKGPLGANQRAWAEMGGDRFDWEAGKDTLEIPAPPGEHTVVVKMRVGGRIKAIYENSLSVDAGQNLHARIAPRR